MPQQGSNSTKPPRLLVAKTKTSKYRYGHLFPAIRDILDAFDFPVRNALSYGCATGEECLTLAELFPEARVTGTDANADMVAAATALHAANPRVRIVPYDAFWQTPDQYDLVCCMSVLFEYPMTAFDQSVWRARRADPQGKAEIEQEFATWLATKFPFSEFESIAGLISSRVRSGGLLVIFNANYRFADTAAGRDYKVIRLPGTNLETMPKCTPDNVLIQQTDHSDILFRKK